MRLSKPTVVSDGRGRTNEPTDIVYLSLINLVTRIQEVSRVPDFVFPRISSKYLLPDGQGCVLNTVSDQFYFDTDPDPR